MAADTHRPAQIAGHWLSKRPNSDNWCATWYDNNGDDRQTRRASLGTADLREAEIRLAAFVTAHGKMRRQAPEATPLATVLVRYWENHAKNLPSHVSVKVALALWTAFWGQALVSELFVERQEEFMQWLKDRGYKNSYVSRVLSVGRAALRRSWKRQEITSVPFIIDEYDRSDLEPAPLLTMEQVYQLLEAAREWPHLFLFCMIGLNTLARPGAIMDLSPFQVDVERRLVHLNPPGRRQTKKCRPTVPLTNTLAPYVQSCNASRFVNWHGEPIENIKRAFATAVKAAGLPESITPYSLRHTMATELRGRAVPEWDVKGFLGHTGSSRVTEGYARYRPDYLSAAVQAIDSYFAEMEAKFGNRASTSTLQPRASCVLAAEVLEAETLAAVAGVREFGPSASTCSLS
ncbi:MAG: tyrosine-type recombinase/integrase [Inquilinus sp.]|uniref:tyrosine-type recombinase/integrase n=1 Tax=Inquilinus sp. TaxID=1932117 RepID=UPI003F2B70BF